MAKKAMIIKQQKEQKYKTREYNRCKLCGRPHGYIRKYGICRICFRELAHKGEIPGVKKAVPRTTSVNKGIFCRNVRTDKFKGCTKIYESTP